MTRRPRVIPQFRRNHYLLAIYYKLATCVTAKHKNKNKNNNPHLTSPSNDTSLTLHSQKGKSGQSHGNQQHKPMPWKHKSTSYKRHYSEQTGMLSHETIAMQIPQEVTSMTLLQAGNIVAMKPK